MFKPWLKPEAETKPDPFSLDALIAWLRTKREGETYNYECNGFCLIATYFRAMDIADSVGGFTYQGRDGKRHDIPEWLGDLAYEEPHSFGGALSRALALKAGGAQ